MSTPSTAPSPGLEAFWFYVWACAISWACWIPVTVVMLGFTDWLPPADPKVGEKISNLGSLIFSRGLRRRDALVQKSIHF